MRASILALSTEVPETTLLQEEYCNAITRHLNLGPTHAQLLKRIINGSKIKKRHTVVTDFLKNGLQGDLFRTENNTKAPRTSQRNETYKNAAPKLAESVCRQALEQWGGNPAEITHIISISCTGMIAPGIEFLLIAPLGLSPYTERLGINFMGCFGAFKGLSIAKSLALENPRHRILVVCIELCSLHFQDDLNTDTMVANALFADGAAAVIVGAEPTAHERSLFEIHSQASSALGETLGLMSWEAGDYGYQMRLSASVPSLLEQNILPFVKHILGNDYAFEKYIWAIHPGGSAILDSITKVCRLKKEQVSASWQVLSDYGNMSSPTFLFVLDEILRTSCTREEVIGLGFGLGLSIEGLLLTCVGAYVAK